MKASIRFRNPRPWRLYYVGPSTVGSWDQELITTPTAQQFAQNEIGADVQPAAWWSPVTEASRHFTNWLSINFDNSINLGTKPELHVDDTAAHYVGVVDIPYAEEAAMALKAQLHWIKFTSVLDLTALAALFDGFAGLSDPAVAQCDKLSPTVHVSVGDEFRWHVSVPSGVSIAMGALFPAGAPIINAVGKRKFDDPRSRYQHAIFEFGSIYVDRPNSCPPSKWRPPSLARASNWPERSWTKRILT